MKSHLFALPLLFALLGASCEPQSSGSSASADKHAVEIAPAVIATSPPLMQPPTDPAKAPSRTSPILVLPLSKPVDTQSVSVLSTAATDRVDYSCKTSADCAVKDVGNCCGQYPACVNKDSRTFPAQVRAQCSKEHRMGVCGFPAIHGCECVAGRCEGQTGMKSNSQIVN